MSVPLKAMWGDWGEGWSNVTRTKELVLVDQEKKQYQVWLEPDFVNIQDLNIYVFQGVSFLYYEESKEYQVDFDVTIFYDPDSGEEIYYESDSSLYACVSNYLSCLGVEKSEEEIENLNCVYHLDNGKFLRDKVLKGEEIEDDGLNQD